jgi:dihydrofolate reductase
MTALRKVVFSTTLEQPPWANTEMIRSDLESTVQRLKQEPGPDLVVLGSGTIVSQLTDARLIDEYQVVVTPVVLGSGRTMFDGVRETMDLRLTGTRVFGNGNVVLRYELVP